MADGMAVIYRRCRPETYGPKVIKSKHKNYSRRNADGKTTKRFSNVHESRSNATLKKSKSLFRERPDIIITIKQNTRKRKRKKSNGQQIPQRSQLSAKRSTSLTTDEYLKILTKKCSTPINHDLEDDISYGMKITHSDTQLYIVNKLSLEPKSLQPEYQHVLNHPLMQAWLRIYRCQLSETEESCCCSCNSDAIFEVMKGLYDCYRKKKCDQSNYVLCDHLTKEERKLGEARKLLTSVGVETDTADQIRIPLAGKTPEHREMILRGLANLGLPLPEGKTPSQKALIVKVKQDLGLPPILKSAAQQEKQDKAAKLGFLQPLEGKSKPKDLALSQSQELAKAKAAELLSPLAGKSPEEREKILRGLAQSSLPLLAGTTESEKKLIANIAEKSKGPSPSKVDKATPYAAAEKLRRAKTASLLSTLIKKTPVQKKKILRGLAMMGLPLSERKTPSDIKLLQKVTNDLGMPPEPKNIAKKDKNFKAQPTRHIKSLEGKTPVEKEKMLRALADKSIPLPIGRTPSQKAQIIFFLAETKKVPSAEKVASEKLHKGALAGISIPLKGKTLEKKEKILRDIAIYEGLLPDGNTLSGIKLIDIVRKDLGLDFPEGRMASEKSLIRKIKASKAGIGITMPLDGKTPSKKETILKKMATAGVLLPDRRTHSVKAIITKLATNLLTPLKGKNPKEQENILKGVLKAGLPLPEGTMPSEKALIKKVKDEFDAGKRSKSAAVLNKFPGKSVVRTVSSGVPAVTQSAKLRKAKTAGLLTPLKDKCPKTQEKILKGLLKAGLLLPEFTTPSEKALDKRVQDEFDAAKKAGGLSPEALGKTDSAKIRRAKASGLVNYLKDKTSEEKQNIIKDLSLVNLSPPKVTTPSEKEMVKNIEADAEPAKAAKRPAKAGLPVPEGGDTRSIKPIRKSKGTHAAVGACVQEEIQEIVETDKCDAACGCSKEKIRYKHSYIKIRVTSPDISSLCPCPNECMPGVKAGVFTNNEGIKVTVGNVSIPSYTVHPQITKRNSLENKHSLQSFKDIDNLVQSQSLLSLKISLFGSDCATDDLNSSKSTVYIFNSQSDVTISDIDHLLRLTLNNDNLKKESKFKTSGEKKPAFNIYRSRFADRCGAFHSCLRIALYTVHLSTSSLRSLYTNTIYETKSSLSHAADLPISVTANNMYDSDTLSKVSYLENRLKYSSQSTNTPQFIERVDDMGPKSTNTLPRKSQSYVKCSNRKIYITNNLGEFSSQLVAKGGTSCGSLRSRNPLRGIKHNMLELEQKVPSSKSLSSSSVFMVVSSSGHGDGSSFLHTTDTLSNLTHSEPSSLLLMNNQPHISSLALNMLVCAKFIAKAKAQKDFWKRKKAEAVLRLRNMAQKIVLQTQELGRRRCVHPHVPVCTSNKYTSSTVASQERDRVEHTVDKTGNRAAYQTRHIDTRIQSFNSPSSFSPQVYVNSQVTTNNSVSIFDEMARKTDNAPVNLRNTCTFAMSAGVDWNSPSFSVHRMKTCY